MSKVIIFQNFTPSQRLEVATLVRRVAAREAELRLIRQASNDKRISANDFLIKLKAKRHELDIASDAAKDWLTNYAQGHLVFCDGRCWFVTNGSLMAVHADRAVDVSSEPREG